MMKKLDIASTIQRRMQPTIYRIVLTDQQMPYEIDVSAETISQWYAEAVGDGKIDITHGALNNPLEQAIAIYLFYMDA
jgi:hypothetical protein